jgi:hypothetical protein
MIRSETIDELEIELEEIIKKNPREAAEVAFALATHFYDKNLARARVFAQRSIDLFRQCKTETYEQCLSLHDHICGILIPELVHDGVVRFRFPKLGL